MPFEPIETKVYKPTSKLAERFAHMTSSPGERAITERRRAYMRRKIAQQKVLTFHWAQASVNGTEYRVDGQLTSHLLAENPELLAALHDNCRVTVSSYACESVDDVTHLYNEFDPAIRGRTSSDYIRAIAAGIDELAGVDTRTLAICVGGYYLDQTNGQGGGRDKTTSQDRAEVLYEEEVIRFSLFVNEVKEACGDESWRLLRRQAVNWAMLLTWRKNPQKAREFWAAAATGSGTDRKLGDRLLNRYLLSTGVIQGGRANRAVDTRQDMCAKCLRCWNAWRGGRQLKKLLGLSEGALISDIHIRS